MSLGGIEGAGTPAALGADMLLPKGRMCPDANIPDLASPVINAGIAADDFIIYICGGEVIADSSCKFLSLRI